MKSAISLITLGVKDLPRARSFYEALGFIASSASQETVCFLQLNNIVLGLYPRHLLAEDAQVSPEGKGFEGIVLAQNVPDKKDVAVVLAEAEAAGGSIVKPAQDVFWGGHSGYFADPDGHLWEIAWNPFFELKEDGTVTLPR